jgi:kynurenine 3-monooxygenase
MNCGFEDVVELDRCLAETDDDWAVALPRYAERRRPNADAIADLALDNFVEMRDKVASPVFRTQKRAEHALERRLPEHFVSLYELVSFSTVPYKDVRRRASHPRQAARAVSATAAAVSAGVIRRIRKDES